jgi:drug/metabolite transporter (DMT)-like permease
VRLNGDWLGFTVWLVLCDSILFIAFALSTRPGAMGMLKKDFAKTLVSGTLGVVSFTIFIWALGRAQVGAVTALRETSILFAALIGTAFLKEPLTAARLVSAALVMAGTAAVAVTR